jgi:hypothetical protein
LAIYTTQATVNHNGSLCLSLSVSLSLSLSLWYEATYLEARSVVIEASQSRECTVGKIGGASASNQAVGVGGIADHHDLDITSSMVVDGLALLLEDGGILLKQVLALHARMPRERTDKEANRCTSKRLVDIGSCHNLYAPTDND